jgi:hypothetical protein
MSPFGAGPLDDVLFLGREIAAHRTARADAARVETDQVVLVEHGDG